MATSSYRTATELETRRPVERRFFTVMALAMIAISLLAFIPSITNPAKRRAPLSALAAAHGVVFFAWLLVFLIQSSLIATHRVAIHGRLGLASIVILALMIPLAYTTTIAMVRRGYDLSGDPASGLTTNWPLKRFFHWPTCSFSPRLRLPRWLIGAGRRSTSG
jgi:hypothetical protein